MNLDMNMGNEPYKRYLLIEIGWYYPNGGIKDVDKSTDDIKEAEAWFNDKIRLKPSDCTFQVFDCDERHIILSYESK